MRATLVGVSTILAVLALSIPAHADAPDTVDSEAVETAPFLETQAYIARFKKYVIQIRRASGPDHPLVKAAQAKLQELQLRHPHEAEAAEWAVAEAARPKRMPMKPPPRDETQAKIAQFKKYVIQIRRASGPDHPLVRAAEAKLEEMEQSVRKRKRKHSG